MAWDFITTILRPVIIALMQSVTFAVVLMGFQPQHTKTLGVRGFVGAISQVAGWYTRKLPDYFALIFGWRFVTSVVVPLLTFPFMMLTELVVGIMVLLAAGGLNDETPPMAMALAVVPYNVVFALGVLVLYVVITALDLAMIANFLADDLAELLDDDMDDR